MNEKIQQLRDALSRSDAVVIGAGAGLSTAAGFIYTGKRFQQYFGDFARKYRFSDMYSGGFYPYPTQQEFWAYWSRYIYVNRYMDPPKPVYQNLLKLVQAKDYFVLTTNVDHSFQKAGFDQQRLFYTQGDFGLFQCAKPCRQETFDNADAVRRMVLAQGFSIAKDGALTWPQDAQPAMAIPDDLLPRCPRCGRPQTLNLRSDDQFAEDQGWHAAAERYARFLEDHKNAKTLFLEAGVGWNTPGIIKLPFWQMTNDWPDAFYVCLNFGEAEAPEDIRERSLCINGDISDVLEQVLEA